MAINFGKQETSKYGLLWSNIGTPVNNFAFSTGFIMMFISFFLFAFPTFVTLCCFCFGRIIYQIGYTAKGYGGHVIGFIIDRFATMTIAGLMILAYQKSFSIDTTI